MIAATIERTVAKSLSTGEASERIQGAKAQAFFANEEWLSFAERVGEMLIRGMNGDVRMGQSAMLQLAFRRQSREG